MSGGSPARQLLLLLGDESAVAEQPIADVVDELAALGLDPSASIATARQKAARPAAPPTPEPIPEPTPLRPMVAEPAAPVRRMQPEEPVVPQRPAYGTAEKGPDLMADIGTRAGGAAEIEERKERRERKERGRGGLALAALGLFAASAAAAVVVIRVWPEVLEVDPATVLDTLVPEKQAAEAEPPPDQPAPEVTVSRVEAVPPPAPPQPEPEPEPVVVAQPQPAPAPPPQPAPQPAAQAVAPAPAAQPSADPNAPLNIVPRVQAPPVQEARLPENVARPFTPPPAIVAFVPVERDLLAESGTGILSSGSRAGGGPSADERRLATRVEEAERIAAGRRIAALVTMSGSDESYDAVILKRPRVDENRTIADADPALIPILGDVAHLFDLVRLAPQ